jgi:hypothetical protein
MITSRETILKLRKAGILSDSGIDLVVLEDGMRFGKDQDAITVSGEVRVEWRLMLL